MSSELDNGDFWLPPEFLTDDDILMDFKPKTHNRETDSVLHFPFDYSSGFNSFNPHSGLSSPVESMLSSESEEEDYLAGLTRKMANSSLVDDLWKTEAHKGWGISVSPQSTLCGCKQGSSRGSPNCPSPPSAPVTDRKDAGRDLLYAAAGEVAKMRMIEEATTAYYQNRGLNPIEPNPNLGYRSNQNLAYQQLQIAKYQQLKMEQLLKQLYAVQQTHHVAPPRARAGDRPPATLSPATWPTLQQSLQHQSHHQPAAARSGMRAVFLGNTGARRESTGTGVFLPRPVGNNAPEPRKKAGGSTVLLPDRVVQALNLNLEAMDAHFDGAVNVRNNVQMGQQQKSLRPPPAATAHADLRLPQEWTY